jgi:mxaD protein
MFARSLALFSLCFGMAGLALAHGPTPQKVEEKIVIAATPEIIWGLLGDFGALASWHPGVKSCRASGGNEAGKAEREVTLQNDKVIREGMDEYDASRHYLGYRLAKENLEALPVSFYSASMEVKAVSDKESEVIWSGRFYRGDTGNFPPENLSDAAAVKAMTEFFQAGLQGLKQQAEAAP